MPTIEPYQNMVMQLTIDITVDDLANICGALLSKARDVEGKMDTSIIKKFIQDAEDQMLLFIKANPL